MAGISPATLERIRAASDIVDVIGAYVPLKKAGANFTALCPFHKEKTPSFHVNPERGFYYCFGCHESGDAIKFVQRIEGLEFSDAVRELAHRAGIEVAETSSEPERRQQAEVRRRQQELYEIGNAAFDLDPLCSLLSPNAAKLVAAFAKRLARLTQAQRADLGRALERMTER